MTLALSLFTFQAAQAATQYGLEWPGDGSVRRMLYWSNPFPIYNATYVFKVHPRHRNAAVNYYTTFFWGNNGTFFWDGGQPNSYYGAHPYPVQPPGGPGQWEISTNSGDHVTGQEIVWDRWYTQAFRAYRVSSRITMHEFYWDLPDTTKVLRKPIDNPAWAAYPPPNPAIVMGQAPNVNGSSWGGYPGWEEFVGIIRGIQIYRGLLSVPDILSEIATPKSTATGASLIWYLNVDPRPGDVTDKKGVGTPNNPSWDGSTAFEWSDGDITGVETPASPAASRLLQNRPNPFNPTTSIGFVLADAGRVKVAIWNARGRRVRTLLDEVKTAGSHQVRWDGRDDRGNEVASGVYLARLESRSANRTIKMALLR